jgi:Reverse transcriptase (RNA-dependent DNA polymerase)
LEDLARRWTEVLGLEAEEDGIGCPLTKSEFMRKWESRDLGVITEFLGIRLCQDSSKLRIDQIAYLKQVLDQFNMTNAKPAPILLPSGYIPTVNNGECDPKVQTRFQQVIGSLLYLSLGTCPDISFAVAKMSQMSTNPTQEHLIKALYICKYLIGTQDYALVYNAKGSEGLVAYTDSDWASDPQNWKSQTGYYVKLASGSIC